MKTYDRMQAAFPGEQFSADIVLQGDNLDAAQIQAAAQRAARRSRVTRISSTSRSPSTRALTARSP